MLAVALASLATATTAATAGTAAARRGGEEERNRGVRRVLLISVDGLHAEDLASYVAQRPASTLARLSRRGTTYTNAQASTPSDSFPGLMALVTGGSPRTTGVWYDNAYDRTLFAAGSDCQGAPGTNTLYDESIDRDLSQVDGGGIDPAKLPLRRLADGQCVPVYPHSFLRVNTIFEVAHEAGLRTAWSDKHPAYDLVNGPSGHGVDDLYTPEINSVDATTASVTATAANDQLKVRALLNEIHGRDSSGTRRVGTPALFGMNFQAVSVGEKIPSGGYLDHGTRFSGPLLQALDSVDGALGQLVGSLRARGLLASSEIIITAKHGQSPRNLSTLQKIGDPIATILGGQPVAQETTDDIALLWFRTPDQTHVGAAATALAADQFGADTAKIDQIYALGNLRTHGFGDPTTDPRVPDIIVQPTPGVIYTTSAKKNEEHGGGTIDDTHVALLVVAPRHRRGGRSVDAPVSTRQVAPSILQALRLDPRALQAVRAEDTQALPLPGR